MTARAEIVAEVASDWLRLDGGLDGGSTNGSVSGSDEQTGRLVALGQEGRAAARVC